MKLTDKEYIKFTLKRDVDKLIEINEMLGTLISVDRVIVWYMKHLNDIEIEKLQSQINKL